MLVYTADCAKWGWKVVIAEEVPYYFKATLTSYFFAVSLTVTLLVIAKNTWSTFSFLPRAVGESSEMVRGFHS